RASGSFSHPLNWLEEAKSDLMHGTDVTWLGKAAKAIGAPGLEKGVSPATAQFMGGPIVGPVTAAHGALTVAHAPATDHPVKEAIRGANETVRGVAQSVAPIAGVTNPEFLPSVVVYGGIQQGAKKTAQALGADPETAELVGNAAAVGAPLTQKALPSIGKVLTDKAAPIGKAVGYGSTLYGAGHALVHGDPKSAAEYIIAAPFAGKTVTKTLQAVGPAITKAGNADVFPSVLPKSSIAENPDSAEPIETPQVQPTPYRMKGSQITQPVTVTPRQILPQSRQLMAPAAAGQNPIPEEVAPFVSEVKPVPLKGKTPTQQQADIFRQMGVASPAASVKPMGKILGATLEPLPKQSFPRISNGESAARYQLSSQGNYGINDLRSIALQRGLP